jgi:hypothetical protein
MIPAGMCSHSDELGVVIHRYDLGQRTCRCGEKSYHEPMGRSFWVPRAKSDPRPQPWGGRRKGSGRKRKNLEQEYVEQDTDSEDSGVPYNGFAED